MPDISEIKQTDNMVIAPAFDKVLNSYQLSISEYPFTLSMKNPNSMIDSFNHVDS